MPFRAIIHSMILQTAGALTLSALLMFLPAGTFAWPQGWLFLALFFGSLAGFMALDAKRFGWSHAPAWAQVVGAVLIVAAFWGWMEVLRANTFAATTIQLQAERGQTVISSGPYALVRHRCTPSPCS